MNRIPLEQRLSIGDESDQVISLSSTGIASTLPTEDPSLYRGIIMSQRLFLSVLFAHKANTLEWNNRPLTSIFDSTNAL